MSFCSHTFTKLDRNSLKALPFNNTMLTPEEKTNWSILRLFSLMLCKQSFHLLSLTMEEDERLVLMRMAMRAPCTALILPILQKSSDEYRNHLNKLPFQIHQWIQYGIDWLTGKKTLHVPLPIEFTKEDPRQNQEELDDTTGVPEVQKWIWELQALSKRPMCRPPPSRSVVAGTRLHVGIIGVSVV
jgi:hypothetical protein